MYYCINVLLYYLKGSDVHIDYQRTTVGQKAVSVSGAKRGIRSR